MKNQKGAIYLVLSLIILFIGLGAVVYSAIQSSRLEKKSPISVNSDIYTSKPLSDWNIYASNDYGYSINYPDEINYEISDDDFTQYEHVYFVKNGTEIMSVRGEKNFAVNDSEYYMDMGKTGTQNIAGKKWNEFYIPENTNLGHGIQTTTLLTVYKTVNNEVLYTISLQEQIEGEGIINDMLSTFKFIN